MTPYDTHASDPAPSMKRWRLDAHREPVVRIGVVLEEDAQQSVVITLDTPRRLLVGGGCETPGVRGELGGGSQVTIALSDDSLAVRTSDGRDLLVPQVALLPAAPQPLRAGIGATVHDVIAGRGFHWQKRIDQALTGVIEILPAARGLVVVNELPLEDYLAGVITSEMGGGCPADLLKAQCVVARSWLLAMTEPKHTREPFDRCNDDCCQRYHGTADLSAEGLAAVRETRGEVLIAPTGVVLDANYSKSCGGVAELPVHIWGIEKPGVDSIVDAPPGGPEHRFSPVTEANLDEYLNGPWLSKATAYCSPQAVPTELIGKYLGRVDAVDEYFRWTVSYTRAEVEALLRERTETFGPIAKLLDLTVESRGVSGRANRLGIVAQDDAGRLMHGNINTEYEIRRVMSRKFLYSGAFAVRLDRDAAGDIATVTLRGAGWGHGVGLCQIGALGMALQNINYRDICRHYFPASRLERGYA